jgi:hypothetical protein
MTGHNLTWAVTLGKAGRVNVNDGPFGSDPDDEVPTPVAVQEEEPTPAAELTIVILPVTLQRRSGWRNRFKQLAWWLRL